METQKNKQSCKDCRFFDMLYFKRMYGFEKQEVGICIQKQIVVQKSNLCEFFKYRIQKDKTVTLEHIDVVIADIEELEKIFYNTNY